ncbi:MAG: hypothetical protein L6R42_003490 [Xanthoria sp. 1 TBL-2021]|nr:MAG: hypothetical protein L6R42_003490 [Xanthoria sp. 1 TBL-2021]
MASSKTSIDEDKIQLTDDLDDYMSMTISESSSNVAQFETSVQRRGRKRREAESRAHQASKAELAHQARLNRDEALNTSLPVSSKGYQMMARLGFKAGSALGKEGNEHARKEPLGVVVKEGRAGIGMDGERKRKFEDGTDRGEGVKKRETEGVFRERQAREREQKRADGLCWGAMRVLEEFESDDTTTGEGTADKGENGGRSTSKPTAGINLLWRGLVKDRDEKERQRRMRYDLHQSLSRSAAYDDPDEEKQDRQTWGTEEEDVEVEDPELDEFNGLEPAERLRKMVEYLRESWRYCFWCKFQYPDQRMDGCPGVTEDEHG